MKINEFCDKHDACSNGRRWAISTGAETMDELWRRNDVNPEWRIWIATRPGALDDRALRLFACWSVRQIWHILTDERSRQAVEVAERYANGNATADELAAARDAARDAAWAAACAAAWDAAWAAAWDAARDAAWAAACAAAWDAAWAAAQDAQSHYLLASTTPNFKGD
jgi:hypothetical protein